MIIFTLLKGPDIAGRCVRPLCFAAPGNEYYGLEMIQQASRTIDMGNFMLGLQGSCTLMIYRSRHLVLFTRHQIRLIDGETPEQFRQRMELLFVLMDDGQDTTNLPIKDFLFSFEVSEDADEDDFVVGIVESSMMTDFMRSHFLPVERADRGRVGDQIISAGFLSANQRVEMFIGGLRNELSVRTGVVGRRAPLSTGTIAYEANADNLDGMSGGAVLAVRLHDVAAQDASFSCFLDGIVQRGGNGSIHYLTIERVLRRIDRHLAGG